MKWQLNQRFYDQEQRLRKTSTNELEHNQYTYQLICSVMETQWDFENQEQWQKKFETLSLYALIIASECHKASH